MDRLIFQEKHIEVVFLVICSKGFRVLLLLEILVFSLQNLVINVLDDFGFSKITDFDVIVTVQQYVVWLQVPMDDVTTMQEL